MSNNINVTIELCKEDRARLDNILDALNGLAVTHRIEAPASAAVEKMAQQISAEEKEAAFFGEPKQEAPAPEKQPEPAPAPQEPAKTEAAPEVTTAELQSKVVQLVGAGKKDEARTIVQEYAKSVSEVPADKRAEVLARLNALEG